MYKWLFLKQRKRKPRPESSPDSRDSESESFSLCPNTLHCTVTLTAFPISSFTFPVNCFPNNHRFASLSLYISVWF